MKKLMLLSLSAIFAAILVCGTSCKKDKPGPTPATQSNAIKYDGKEFALTGAIDTWYGPLTNYLDSPLRSTATPLYFNQIQLIGEGLTPVEKLGVFSDFSGKGYTFSFFIMSANTSIKNQTYSVTPSTSPIVENTLSKTYLCYIDRVGTSGTETEIVSGTMTYTGDETSCEITFTGKDANGKTLTAYYKGSLKKYHLMPS